jgi:hypothetical protein
MAGYWEYRTAAAITHLIAYTQSANNPPPPPHLKTIRLWSSLPLAPTAPSRATLLPGLVDSGRGATGAGGGMGPPGRGTRASGRPRVCCRPGDGAADHAAAAGLKPGGGAARGLPVSGLVGVLVMLFACLLSLSERVRTVGVGA